MNIINYNCCYICATYIETLEHMFFECTEIRNLWIRIFQDLRLEEKFENLKLNKRTVLLGYNNEDNFISGINIFIVLVKKYIFDCKQKGRAISFESAKYYLKYQCKIQKSVSKNANREWGFLDAWL